MCSNRPDCFFDDGHISSYTASFARSGILRIHFLPCIFLSAAQPTDQGEESVVLLLLLVVVVGGDHFSVSHVQFFGV